MLNEQIFLGDKVEDEITGFTGVVTRYYKYITGCDRVTISRKPKSLAGSPSPYESYEADVITCEVLTKGARKAFPITDLKLGNNVKDNISGLSGYITSIVYDMDGGLNFVFTGKDLLNKNFPENIGHYTSTNLCTKIDEGIAKKYGSSESNKKAKKGGPALNGYSSEKPY